MMARKPGNIAEGLTVPERTLLFSIAGKKDWQKTSSITDIVVTGAVVKGLIDRDAARTLTLTERGRALLAALIEDRS
jgi:hypothetical protein